MLVVFITIVCDIEMLMSEFACSGSHKALKSYSL